ncbi:MAG: DNA repair protein RadC [Hornefia sp.]|nr:DNA repair protein RadC [Hornefia sp.]
MLIKSMPMDERPLEKAVREGIKALSNSELIGIMLHTGTKNMSSIRLAEAVLSLREGGISELGEIQYEELLEIAGIGPSKAITVLAALEIGKRVAASSALKRHFIQSSHDVADLFMETLRHEKKEHFKSVMMNTKGEIIAVETVSVGALSNTVVHPREVFCSAVRKSAAGIIFVHNHPSGDPKPSEEDIITTERLKKGGEILGIKVLDHIIIGNGKFSSFKAMDLL